MTNRMNLVVTEVIREKMERQAKERGMNLSSYLAHLVVMEEERQVSQKRLDNVIKMMPNGLLELAEMIKLVQSNENQEEGR